jgi:hypothetical protein
MAHQFELTPSFALVGVGRLSDFWIIRSVNEVFRLRREKGIFHRMEQLRNS